MTKERAGKDIAVIVTVALAIIGFVLRVEHRLTTLETKVDGIRELLDFKQIIQTGAFGEDVLNEDRQTSASTYRSCSDR